MINQNNKQSISPNSGLTEPWLHIFCMLKYTQYFLKRFPSHQALSSLPFTNKKLDLYLQPMIAMVNNLRGTK